MLVQGSLSKKILVSILMVSSIVTTLVTVVQLRFDFSQEMNAVERNMELIKVSYLSSISQALWDMDNQQIKVQLDGILKMPNVVFVEIHDTEGKKTAIGKLTGTHILSRIFPLETTRGDEATKLGALRVSVSLEEIYAKLYKKVFVIFFTQLLKTLSVLSICYFVLRHILTRHLIHIAKYLEDFDFLNPPPDFVLKRGSSQSGKEDELDILAFNINRMKSNLVSSYGALKELTSTLEARVEEKTLVVYEQSRRLEQSSKMSALGEMAGGVAHEINNPLAIIKTLSSQLQEALNDALLDIPLVKEMASRIETTTDRIAKIVQGLRTFSRDGSRDSFSVVNLRQLLDETLSFCSERFRNHGIKLEVGEVSPSLCFEGRATECSQVLLNLLNNSYDAIALLTDKWIKVTIIEEMEWIELRVADSGNPIPLEVQKKIFRPFFTTKDIGKGTGMGLSISQGIVQSQGGSLRLDTNSAKTCFVVRLPKKQTDKKQA